MRGNLIDKLFRQNEGEIVIGEGLFYYAMYMGLKLSFAHKFRIELKLY